MYPRKRLLWFICLALAVMLGAGCTADPNKKKSMFLARAEQFMSSGRYGEAVIEFRNALKIEPQNADIHYRLGQAYLQHEQFPEAYQSFGRTVELNPKHIDARLEMVKFQLVFQQYAEAVQSASQLCAEYPDNIEAAILLANAFAGEKQYDNGIDTLRTLMGRHPESVGVHVNLALLYSAAGRKDLAATQLQQAITLDPSSVDARKAIAAQLSTDGDYAGAEAQYLEGVNRNPDSKVALKALADFYVLRGRNAEAESAYRRIVELDGRSARSRYELGLFFESIGNLQHAADIYRGVAEGSNGYVPARYQLVEMEIAQGKFNEAEQTLTTMLADRQSDPRSIALRSRIFLGRGEIDRAVTELQRGVRQDPNVPMLHLLLAKAYTAAGKTDLAFSSYEQALSLGNDLVDAHLGKADLLLIKRDYAGAVRVAEQALELDPANVPAMLIAASAYANDGKFSRAEALLSRCKQIAPGNADAFARMGFVALKQQHFAKAEENFRAALKSDPVNMDALRGITHLLCSRKQAGAAIKLLENASAARDSSDIQVLAGNAYLSMGDEASAESSFRKAIDLDTRKLSAYQQLAAVQTKQKKMEAALETYRLATVALPYDANAWALYGNIAQRAGQLPLAQKALERAIELDSNNIDAAVALSHLYLGHSEKFERALEMAVRAKNASPGSAAASDALGWVYYNRQLYDTAVGLLQDAVKSAPENPEYRVHLGACLAAKGKKSEARREIEAAMRLDSGLRSRPDVQQYLGRP